VLQRGDRVDGSEIVPRCSFFEERCTNNDLYNGRVKRLIVLVLLVVACRNERPLPPVAPSADQNTPQDGGTVVRRLDVDVTTLNPIADPQTEAAQIAGGFENLDLKATHVVDDRTIVVAFREALAPQVVHFNDLLVVPEHVYSQGDFKTDFISRAVGTGPYRLV